MSDDTVTVSTADLRAFLKTRDFDAGERLWAIANPPPEFDPTSIETLAAALWNHDTPSRPWDTCRSPDSWRTRAESILANMYRSGWTIEPVDHENQEITILRQVVSRMFMHAPPEIRDDLTIYEHNGEPREDITPEERAAIFRAIDTTKP